MASTEPLRLDLLPVEIIHRILAQGPCTNALAFSRVSKSLRAISTNPLVYRDIVESGNGFDSLLLSVHGDPLHTQWVDRSFRNEQDWHLCARWVLADQKANESFFQCENIDSSNAKNATYDDDDTDDNNNMDYGDDVDKFTNVVPSLLPFLPELLSQKYESILSHVTQETLILRILNSEAFWFGQFKQAGQRDLQAGHIDRVTRAAFVYAYGCTFLPMSAKEAKPSDPSYNIHDTVHQLDWYLPSTLSDVIKSFLSFPRLDQDLWSSHLFLTTAPPAMYQLDEMESKLHRLRRVTLCTLMVGILHRRLGLVIYQQVFVHGPHTGGHNLNTYPPVNFDFPLELAFPNTPPAFTDIEFSNENSLFIMHHIPHMTSSEFLTDGEWIGYYTYAGPQGPLGCDPVMHGIFFEVTASHPGYHEVISNGQDIHGRFALRGAINIANGQVQMTKHYVHGTFWEWSGVMTAFGIVGAWGDAWGGWFWLWKKQWTNRRIQGVS